MSVIVPVYNRSEFLDKSLGSLVAQDADPSTFEVLLIDDGSTDGSLEKCRDFERRHEFIRVISQENQGVSGARNTGLKNATGEYVTFLDADDSLSPNAVSELTAAFSRFGDAVDVVATDLRYYSLPENRTFGHIRSRWLKETGVYQLDKTPFIGQTTMNICIRNRFEDNIAFDTSLRVGEDQLFVTCNLARKAAMGYCAEAEYLYTKGIQSASAHGTNPLYSFDEMLGLYHRLFDIASSHERMQRYIYALILYNINWRLKSSRLLPLHLSGDDYVEAERKIASVLGSIPHSAYAASPHLNAHHKAFLLERYVHPGEAPEVVHDEKKTIVTFEDGSTWGTAKAKISIEQCLFHDDVLHVQGRVTCPSFRFESKPAVRVVTGGGVMEPELGLSSFSHANSKMLLGKIWWLEFRVDAAALRKREEISLELLIDGEPVPFELSPSLRRHNARVVDGVYYFPHLEMHVDKMKIRAIIQKAEHPRRVFFGADRRNRAEKELRSEIRREASRLGGRRLWLYVDDPSNPVTGEALVQLLRDLARGDGIERVYVSDFAEELVYEHPELVGKIVSPGSDMHKRLSLLAELILFTSTEENIRRPFGMADLAGIGDLSRDQKLVFLPHGVMHALKPWELSRDRLLADAVVATTRREAELLTTLYGYDEEQIIESGLPRFDVRARNQPDRTGRILLAFSWRDYLLAGSGRTRMPVESAFEESAFFEGITSLVRRVRSGATSSEEGCVLEIRLHPRFLCYRHVLERAFEGVSGVELHADCWSGPAGMGEYEVVITDFSSLAYDAAYAGCNVVYYVPDYIEFKAGLHEYREIDPPFEKGFGPLCKTVDEVMGFLDGLLRDNGRSDDVVCRSRDNEKTFLQVDGCNSERLYRSLMELLP